ncbi:MAG: S-layer homology domain-containing protein [Leptolyngbya sp. SIO1D8]|nr:S-layer homology domain-containing protein [Leptolyngbya sp. SIO1D8]
MNKQSIWMGFTVLGLATIAPGAIANEQASPSTLISQPDSPALTAPTQFDAITNSPKLSEANTKPSLEDAAPTHWAYPAVINLVEVYGCLSGYPDSTFQGEQTLTRYEFVAAMNTCLGTFMELVEQERQIDLGEILEELVLD